MPKKYLTRCWENTANKASKEERNIQGKEKEQLLKGRELKRTASRVRLTGILMTDRILSPTASFRRMSRLSFSVH